MDTEYEVLEDNGRSMKIKVKSTGRTFDLKMPSFGDRDEIQTVIDEIQKKGEPVRKLVDDIARKRKVKTEAIYAMIKEGGLTAEEELAINEATMNSKITGKYLEKIISFVLVTPDNTDNINYIKKMDIDEGIAVCSAAMSFLPKCLNVGAEERKK